MSSVPMPRDLSEEAVAEWLYGLQVESPAQWRVMARAVRALLREKVREAADAAVRAVRFDPESLAVAQSAKGALGMVESIVADVLGEEAPRA